MLLGPLRRPLILACCLLAGIPRSASWSHAETVRLVFEWGGGDKTKLVWDGEITLEGGRLAAAENYQMDGAPEGYYDLTERSVKFRGFTEGATDGLIITVEGPLSVQVHFSSPVKSFDFPLSQAVQQSLSVKANEQGAFITVGAAPEVSLATPRQECRSVVADSTGRVWMVGVGTDGPETSMASRQTIVLARCSEDTWEPVANVAGPGIVYFPRIVPDEAGGLWIAWSQFEDRNWDIYARHFDGTNLAEPVWLTSAPAADLLPAICMAEGGPIVAWESGANHTFRVVARRLREGKWGPEFPVTEPGEMAFRPVLACGADGAVWVAYDAFDAEAADYDVFLRSVKGGRVSARMTVLGSSAEEMDADIAIDRSGTVWVVASGKCIGMRGGERGLPPEELTKAARAGNRGPSQIAFDEKGRLWLFAARPGGRNQQPFFRAAFAGEGAPPVIGGAAIDEGWDAPLVSADGTAWLSSETTIARIRLPLPADYPAGPVSSAPASVEDPLLAKTPPERSVFERRQVQIDGKPFNVYYGELHTHLGENPADRTIRTWVDRFYTNARHVAQLDIASISDHDWPRMTLSKFIAEQAFAAVLNEAGRFTACIGWEWSGDGPTRYRYGDRTVVFLRDYSDILRITDEAGNEPAKLHEFLTKQGAIDWPHHVGASWAVMDWDTLSPVAEPVVEMTSVHGVYETYDPDHAVGAWLQSPKQSRDNTGDKTSIQYGLSQGRKFGLVGSSDSHSGISGYETGMLAVYAPELSRESVFEAWRARRTYALRGGQRILVDFRINGAFMGSEIAAEEAPRLSAKVVGTARIEKVEVIRNNEYIYTVEGAGPTVEFDYLDNNAPAGSYYYYLRIFQEGQAYAWSSPIWVTIT